MRMISRLALLLLLSALCASPAQARDEWFRGLDLEGALARADLVMVARVADVSETKIVLGGKGETSLVQFKFEPVRTLKGVFTRETLSLTDSDLGAPGFGEPVTLVERGQIRLLILGRSDVGYVNVNQLPGLNQSLPSLTDENDSLIGAVEMLIAMNHQRDSAKKAALAVDGLRVNKGAAAIPLLRSLERRALLVAQTPNALAVITKLLGDPLPAVREQAALTIKAILDADYLNQRKLREEAAAAVLVSLDRVDPDIAARVAAIRVLSSTGEISADNKAALAWLQVEQSAESLAETAARLRSIAELKLASQRDAVLALFQRLPLDAPPELGHAAGLALIAVAPEQATRELGARYHNKFAAGLDVRTEIGLLGALPVVNAVPALLEVAKDPLSRAEQSELVLACERIVEQTPETRLIPILERALDPRRPELRWHAVQALRKINKIEAAKVLQPHLTEEMDLARKLQLAEFLGRHKYRDGYAYAMEHVSEPSLQEQAVAALAAIREPKAIDALRKILRTSNDTSWNSAAIRALGRLRDKESAPQFLQIVQDLNDPLAPAALIALGDLGEANSLANLRVAFDSRNDEMVTAAARAAGKLLALPSVKADDLRDRLVALLVNASAPQATRAAALDALLALNDGRLNNALGVVVRDAGLEGSDLLRRIEALVIERKLPLALR